MKSGAAVSFTRFVITAAAVVAALAAVGYLPTRRWGGPAAVEAMLVGCGVSLGAAVLGALPLAAASPAPQARAQAVLLGMALRFMAALGAGVAMAWAGDWRPAALLGWLAVSYVALLAVEVRFAVGGASG